MHILAGARVRHVHVVHENARLGADDRISTPRPVPGDGLERVFPQHQGNGAHDNSVMTRD